MKANTHPQYNPATQVTCTCGNQFITGSTQDKITVEICSACHPFFTGEVKYVDLAGRVDKFTARMEKAKKTAPKSKKGKQAAADDSDVTPQSLKDMLQGAKSKITSTSSSKKSS